jgi:hypothetical protein
MFKIYKKSDPNVRWANGKNIINYSDRLNATINAKYILVSWLHSGSCFSRELIRENFPECVDINLWGKTHWELSEETINVYRKAKIFFILSDPRDTATRVGFIENGYAGGSFINEFSDYAFSNRNSYEYLNENFIKISNLLDFYQHTFGDQCIVLKYEDAYFNPEYFLNKVGEFLKLKALYIDDIRKYKHSIHKEIGIFNDYYNEYIINQHYNLNHYFYNRWEYPLDGYKQRFYIEDGGLEILNYFELLKRNYVNINDPKLLDRIKNINFF